MKLGARGANGQLGRAVVSERLQRLDEYQAVVITRASETVSGSGRMHGVR
jgi:uncharacterized protein YbjT (DUF2867 family)